MSSLTLSYVIPSVILLGALATDLRTRKIYNKWVAICIVLAIFNSFYFFGWEGLQQGALAGGLALVATVPLVLIGALGAGDMKILFAFGLASTYQGVFSVLIFSILWGGLIGIALAVLRGQGKRLFNNTLKIILAKPRDESTYQKMPYSVALVLGWITFIVLSFWQGGHL